MASFCRLKLPQPSLAPGWKPSGLWVEGQALELDAFFDQPHLFVRPLLANRLPLAMGKHLVQAQPLVYTHEYQTGKHDNKTKFFYIFWARYINTL